MEAPYARRFRSDGPFVMDASKRSGHGNVHFVGFGRTKRIVFFDTLLPLLSPEEVGAVVVHELGHFKHHDVHLAMIRIAALTFFFFVALGWAAYAPWLFHAFGLARPDDGLALLIFMLCAGLLGPLKLIGWGPSLWSPASSSSRATTHRDPPSR
jgi:STE24 endopeptidase